MRRRRHSAASIQGSAVTGDAAGSRPRHCLHFIVVPLPPIAREQESGARRVGMPTPQPGLDHAGAGLMTRMTRVNSRRHCTERQEPQLANTGSARSRIARTLAMLVATQSSIWPWMSPLPMPGAQLTLTARQA